MEKDEVPDEWEEQNGLWWHMCEEGLGLLWQTREWREDKGLVAIQTAISFHGYVVVTEHKVQCKGCGKEVVYEEEWIDHDPRGKHSKRKVVEVAGSGLGVGNTGGDGGVARGWLVPGQQPEVEA